MNSTLKKVIYGVSFVFVAYIVMKLLIFIVEGLFNFVVDLTTSGTLLIIIGGFFLYRYRRSMGDLYKRKFKKGNYKFNSTFTKEYCESNRNTRSREKVHMDDVDSNEVLKEIIDCGYCHQKNSVIIGKTNPICGHCRNPLYSHNTNESNKGVKLDVFNNPNQKIIVKNMELGFFDELSFTNFIAFLTRFHINAVVEGYDNPINDLIYDLRQKYEFMFFVRSTLDSGNIHFILKDEESSMLITFSTVMLLVQSYKGSQKLFEKVPKNRFGVFDIEIVGKVALLEDIFMKPNFEFESYKVAYIRYVDMIQSLHEQQGLTGEGITHKEYGYGTVDLTRDDEVFVRFEDPEAGNMRFPLLDTELEFVNYPRPKQPIPPVFNKH